MASHSHAARPTPTALLGIPVTDLTMIVVVLIWGINFSVVKLALAQIPPFAFAALRFAIGSVLLWIILRVVEGPKAIPREMMWKLIWVGVVGNTIYQLCFIYGLTITTAANGSLLISTTPAMVVLAGAALKIERMNRNMVIGVILAFSGVAFVISARGMDFSWQTISGDLLMIAASVCWTIYTLGVRTLGAGISPLRITTMTMITGVPGLLLFSVPDFIRTDWTQVSGGAWLGLAYATILALVLAYVLWNNSVRVVGGNRTAIYGCVIPLVAAITGWLVLNEHLVIQQGIGAALIIGGVLMTRRV